MYFCILLTWLSALILVGVVHPALPEDSPCRICINIAKGRTQIRALGALGDKFFFLTELGHFYVLARSALQVDDFAQSDTPVRIHINEAPIDTGEYFHPLRPYDNFATSGFYLIQDEEDFSWLAKVVCEQWPDGIIKCENVFVKETRSYRFEHATDIALPLSKYIKGKAEPPMPRRYHLHRDFKFSFEVLLSLDDREDKHAKGHLMTIEKIRHWKEERHRYWWSRIKDGEDASRETQARKDISSPPSPHQLITGFYSSALKNKNANGSAEHFMFLISANATVTAKLYDENWSKTMFIQEKPIHVKHYALGQAIECGDELPGCARIESQAVDQDEATEEEDKLAYDEEHFPTSPTVPPPPPEDPPYMWLTVGCMLLVFALLTLLLEAASLFRSTGKKVVAASPTTSPPSRAEHPKRKRTGKSKRNKKKRKKSKPKTRSPKSPADTSNILSTTGATGSSSTTSSSLFGSLRDLLGKLNLSTLIKK